MVKYASRFQFVVMMPGGYSVVSFGYGEVGVYLSEFRNSFGTSLALRGPREEVEEYLASL